MMDGQDEMDTKLYELACDVNIVNQAVPKEAWVQAFQAGIDMVLIPALLECSPIFGGLANRLVVTVKNSYVAGCHVAVAGPTPFISLDILRHPHRVRRDMSHLIQSSIDYDGKFMDTCHCDRGASTIQSSTPTANSKAAGRLQYYFLPTVVRNVS